MTQSAITYQPYIGEIQAFAFSFGSSAMVNGAWLPCNGQLLSIAEYQPLYSLIGLLYGGDGLRHFGLPNLNGRTAIGQGQGAHLTNRMVGQQIGTPTVTLDVSEMPLHQHGLQLAESNDAASKSSGPGAPGSAALLNPQYPGFTPDVQDVDTTFASPTVQDAGDQAPHENMQPYLPMWWCICVEGEYPPFPPEAEPDPAVRA